MLVGNRWSSCATYLRGCAPVTWHDWKHPRMGTVQLSGIVTLANTVLPNPRNLRRPHPSHVRHGVPILGRQRLAVRQHLTASGHGVTCRDESEAQRRSQPEMSRGRHSSARALEVSCRVFRCAGFLKRLSGDQER